MKRKITASVKQIQAEKKLARAEKNQAKKAVHPLEIKTDAELVRLNLQLSTYLLNLPGGAEALTAKDKEEWKMVRSILKKRGISIPTKVIARNYSKEVLSLATGI